MDDVLSRLPILHAFEDLYTMACYHLVQLHHLGVSASLLAPHSCVDVMRACVGVPVMVRTHAISHHHAHQCDITNDEARFCHAAKRGSGRRPSGACRT